MLARHMMTRLTQWVLFVVGLAVFDCGFFDSGFFDSGFFDSGVFGHKVVSGQETGGRKYAILVGVREYDRNQLKDLPFAENDVAELAEILKQSGFRRVELLTQAEGAKDAHALPLAKTIRETIQGVLEDRDKEDLVLIAFAGHGLQFKGEKENYFCPMDAVLTDRSTLISLTDVYEQLKQSKAGAKLLLVDACRNDPLAGNARAAGDVELQSKTRPQIPDPPGGVAAFFSCSAGQRAFEDETLKHGVFFHHVILGLKGEAKMKKREEVTWDSLVAYVKAEVPDTVKDLFGNSTRQIPEHRGELRGGATLISFIRPPQPVAPVPAPSSPAAKVKVAPLVWPFTAAQAKAAQESLAKSLGKNVVEKNSLGMELVIIPPGKFTMGSPANEAGRFTDEDQVEVTLPAPIWMGMTEVTQGQWEKVMGTTPWKGQSYVKEGPDYAATYVSWEDAQEFLKKLSQGDGFSYRLPTEAEWEWSCRAGTSSRFSFGDNDSELGRYGWYGGLFGDGNAKTEQYAHEVGKKLANPFGLYDLHGNVWEWCEDIKIDKLPGGNNPKVLAGGNVRVLRGGSWNDDPHLTRSAIRIRYSPDVRIFNVGFRISRTQ